MKALVLAGGFGTRLRPLSCTRPKLLFPVGGQTQVDWTLKNLNAAGVDTVVMAVNYMAEALVRYLGPTKHNLGIIYSREQRPLGTGGPIKKAEELLKGEPFLVLNGDIIADIDYKRFIEFHKQKGALATVALVHVDDPSRFGSVELDSVGRIVKFVEKPAPGFAPSNLINAGIYILDPKIFDYIPEKKKVSIEREVFPRIAEEKKLFGFEVRGFWVDVGVPEDYLKANNVILSRYEGVEKADTAKIDPLTSIIAPCYIGPNVEVGSDCLIGPNTTLSENVLVGKGCRIENSVIFSGASIGDYTSIKTAVIGENVVLERWVKVEAGSMIGDYVTVGDGVTITQGVTICPTRNISESILTHKQVM